ncbi:MAG: 2-C-methyl-D-erythritol 2,4-cyclodiphosphate synthase [Candidatus Edwardsbacteria bacterium]|nr:2-C-methyl-D-erythritol 2,4-cyclodiphosphate synthase [Candidatus Edwardsbacteria bacterium]
MAAQKKMTRVGFGFDVHKLVTGRKLVLGGVGIKHGKGLLGHSDADVLCHAIADSILGAAALGDIGTHFPNSDPAFRGISSLTLLEHVAHLIKSNRYHIVNVDSTVIAEEPKIMPHVDKMRGLIARALGVEVDQVSVKATTNEGLGHLGRKQGICAYAVSMISR